MTILTSEPINLSALDSFMSTPLQSALPFTLLQRRVKPLSVPKNYLHPIQQPLSSLTQDVFLPSSFLLVPHETDETSLAYLPFEDDLDFSEFEQTLYFTESELLLGFIHPVSAHLVYVIQLPYTDIQRVKVSHRGWVHQVKLWLPQDFNLKFIIESTEDNSADLLLQKLQSI